MPPVNGEDGDTATIIKHQTTFYISEPTLLYSDKMTFSLKATLFILNYNMLLTVTHTYKLKAFTEYYSSTK